MAQFKHMLVATDLTDKSVNAVERALQLKREGAAERMTILHVVEGGFSAKIQERRCAEALLDCSMASADLCAWRILPINGSNSPVSAW